MPRPAKADLQLAVEDFEKAAKLNPREPENFTGRGMANFQLRRPREAITDYTRAITLNPKSATAYFYRAMARAQISEFHAALTDLDAVIRIDDDPEGSSRALVYPMRAGILITMRRYDDALADSAKMIELRPKSPAGYSLRAIVWGFKGDEDNALKDLSRGIEGVPAKAAGALYLLRGGLRERKSEYRKALADFKAAAAIGGKDADVASNRAAYILATCPDERVRDYKEAIRYAQRAYELVKGKDWKAVAMLATAYAQAGQFPHAVKWQERAISMAPVAARSDLEARLKSYRAGRPFHGKGR